MKFILQLTRISEVDLVVEAEDLSAARKAAYALGPTIEAGAWPHTYRAEVYGQLGVLQAERLFPDSAVIVTRCPDGFLFSEEAHKRVVAIVAEVFGIEQPESWNGFIKVGHHCETMSVRTVQDAAPELYAEAARRIAEISWEQLEGAVQARELLAGAVAVVGDEGKSVKEAPASAPPRYYLLNADEQLRDGDEYFDPELLDWDPTPWSQTSPSVGRVRAGDIWRRKE